VWGTRRHPKAKTKAKAGDSSHPAQDADRFGMTRSGWEKMGELRYAELLKGNHAGGTPAETSKAEAEMIDWFSTK